MGMRDARVVASWSASDCAVLFGRGLLFQWVRF